MKKLNIFLNVIMGAALVLWGIQAMLSYQNYTRHVELFAQNGWYWYTNVLAWGKVVVPVVAACLILKFVFRKKTGD